MKKVELAVSLLCVGIIAIACLLYFKEFVDWAILPFWDEASHSIKGAKFTRQIAELRFFEFLDNFYSRNGLWPPLLGLFQIPVFAVFGYEFEAARMLTRGFWLAGAVLIFILGYRLGDRRGLLFPFLITTLFMLNPFLQAHANLATTEIPGATLMCLLVLIYITALEQKSHKLRKLTYFASFLFFIYKYNYAAIFVVPMILTELRTAWSDISWRNIVKQIIEPLDMKRWFFWLIAVYILFLAAIHLSGGFVWHVNDDITIFMQKIAGNPLYILILLVAIYLYSYKRPQLGQIYHYELNQDFRAWLHWSVLPVVIWLINPHNFRGFLGHSVNHGTLDASFWDQLSFYPLSFVHVYFATPLLGSIILVGCILSLLLWRWLNPGMRFVGLLVFCGFIMITLHQHKAPRHLTPLVPMMFVWTSASVFVLERRFWEVTWTRWLSCAIIIAVTSVALALSWQKTDFIIEEVGGYSYADQPEQLLPALDCLCEISKAEPGVSIMGIWNRMSNALVTQYCWSRFAPFPLDHSPHSMNARRVFYASGDWRRILNRFDISVLVLTHYDGSHVTEFNHAMTELKQHYDSVRESEFFTLIDQKQCGDYYSFEVFRVVNP